MPESLFPYVLIRQSTLPLDLVSALGTKENTPEETLFNEILHQNIAALKSFSDNPVLQNGLLYSSHSLLERLPSFRDKPSVLFRKKEWQTARTLAQYLTRIAAKTSPFAGFTAIGVAGTGNNPPTGIDPEHTSAYQYNHLLFSWLKELFLAYPPLYHLLDVRINQMVLTSEEDYMFLLNSRNVESVQYLEKQPLVNWIITLLQKGSLRYDLLVGEIAVATEESTQAIEPYLLQLLSIGLLDFDWELPLASRRFLSLFTKKIKALPEFEKKEFITGVLDFLQKTITTYPLLPSPMEKKLLLQSVSRQLLVLKKELFPEDNPAPQDKGFFGRFLPLDYPFSDEQVIYEDKYLPFAGQLSQDQLTHFTKRFDLVFNLVKTYVYNDSSSLIKDTFSQGSASGKPVPLLLFYEKYYQIHKSREETSPAGNTLVQWVKKNISGNAREVSLPLEAFRVSDRENNKQTVENYGALIQPFEDHGHPCAVVNATFRGNGRMWGRYLDHLPPVILKAVRDKKELQQNDCLLAEISDASCMNANLHPPILPYQIVIAMGESDFPPEQQLALKDLVIDLNPDEKTVFLMHKPTGKRVVPFDMGLEAPANRSPMYRMLLEFSPVFPSHRFFNQAVNAVFSEKDSQGIRHLPRIHMDNQLILQRRSWQIPLDRIPLQPAGYSLYQYYCLLRDWQRSLSLPNLVFYTLIPAPVSDEAPRDQFKPQFLDFSSPVLVDLFQRQIKKGHGVKIEEMLPMPEQLKEHKDGVFCQEWVIEWSGRTS